MKPSLIWTWSSAKTKRTGQSDSRNEVDVSKLAAQFLPERCDHLAPDGAEIRLFTTMNGGGLAHCTLHVGGVSRPVNHLTVEEIWFCLEGEGQVWRQQESPGEPIDVFPGMSLTIPTGTHFQFRNTGNTALRFIIVTMPPWPAEDEAVTFDQGYWPLAQ